MAAVLVPSFRLVIKQISLFYVIPVVTLGIVGDILNIIVFLSLKTFRKNSCAFYLMIMAVYNIGRYLINISSFVIIWGFEVDWRISRLYYCHFSPFIRTICLVGSLTCLCLATIDQYFATSTRLHWHQWSNIKLAHRLTTLFAILWILQAIPYGILFEEIPVFPTNTTTCDIVNVAFRQYHTYGYVLTLSNLIPLITIVFGFMAYHNARNLARRTVPLVRRELDKQLTVMVLVQVLISFFTLLPHSIQTMCVTIITNNEFMFRAQMNLAGHMTNRFSILGYASGFYIYICVSKRFRRQVKYVLYEAHVKRFKLNQIHVHPNQITAEVFTNKDEV